MNLPTSLPRVFPDTNVIIDGIVSEWSVSRAVLILARNRAFRLLLAPYVESEVERFLLRNLARDYERGGSLIDTYHQTLTLLAPERLPEDSPAEIQQHLSFIRHSSDVPVLVAAIKAQPDWLITANVEHFTPAVAARTGLRIVTPHEFLRLFKL